MLYRKSVLAMLLALIFLSFFGTLGLSASMFPENYDWRYRVISNLLSPRDNPNYRWLPACGISVAALLMLPLAGYLRRHLEIASPGLALLSSGAFLAGIVALICACLVVPQHVHAILGIRRLHELLARCSAAFMAIGFLGMDGGRSCVRIPLCGGFPNAAGWNAEQGRRADEILTAFLKLER